MAQKNCYFHVGLNFSVWKKGIERTWCQNRKFFQPFYSFSTQLNGIGFRFPLIFTKVVQKNCYFHIGLILSFWKKRIERTWCQNRKFFQPFYPFSTQLNGTGFRFPLISPKWLKKLSFSCWIEFISLKKGIERTWFQNRKFFQPFCSFSTQLDWMEFLIIIPDSNLKKNTFSAELNLRHACRCGFQFVMISNCSSF